ncbi:DNA methylase [Petrotoga miotherma DSM 10691]|uniref:DNA methylase n=1 Tax=Petrotoga miotherma DSM 10691 TaxID=1434326 RepID=A0A2K1PEL0_9BACT|nr:site-specific DNA-methyltransferase [Petrotoga miotherma]PNS01241.1 DNA methylase [Petrotoga miotherma DSM 10691]
MTKEEIKFFDALEDIFVGAKVEGESGYINLMRIKSNYYKKGVFPQLKKDIDDALKPFPKFRGELFDKLYTFFNRYFSETGSIYFRYTPFHQNVYEKVYTDDKDVILFWKTHMLYYVKTDRLFKNLEVEIDDHKYYFDVSTLEYKKANEKREIIYEFKEGRKDGMMFFNVLYSERGKKTKIDDILRSLKKEGITTTEEELNKAFRVFEKQSEVDYFINKNAKEFLKEQFNIWLYQYVFSGESEWTEERIKELQVLKDIAFKIIDFISQFEDELVKIWNKPKFVLNSNYVITLDRIAQKDIEIVEKIMNHEGFEEQVKEWKELGIVDKELNKNNILENSITGKQLTEKYKHLPIDTKYFKDLELKILDLFDDLDNSLDGWLIKSENYQALNTILPKFKEKVQTIYIDPPFNKDQDADYFYSVKYKDSSWITLLENRLLLSKDILNNKGSIFVRCDYNGNMYVRLLMNEIFGEENFRNEIVIKRGSPKAGLFTQFGEQKSIGVTYDNLYWFSKIHKAGFPGFMGEPTEKQNQGYWTSFTKIYDRPTMRYEILGINITKGQWMWGKERALKAAKNYDEYLKEKEKTNESLEEYWKKTGKKLDFLRRKGNTIQYWVAPRENVLLDNTWTDIPGYSSGWGFKTENSEILLKRVIESTSEKNSLVMDFFLGSGTTTAVSHKLGRKWLGVEMGEHFYSVILPRMKKVLAYDKSGISKEKDVKEKYNQNNAGGFFKYYELEQYEDTLRKVKYEDSTLFDNPYEDSYNQYVFMKDLKMLEALEIDYENNKVKVDLSKLYKDIDIAETLSNLTGKWIKKIHSDYVEFEYGEKINLKDLDYKLIKPLIWW